MRIDQTVLQAKRFGVYSCRQDASLRSASEYMVAEDISALVVLDHEGYLVGIVTRTDMLRAYLKSDDWHSQTVESIMNRQVITVTPQTHLAQVAELLVDHQIHRVVVVREEDGKQRPVSVVSAADLLYHMVKDH